MIAEYEADQKAEELYSPRVYGTNLRHKHLPEMQKVAGLERPPVFCPVVDDYYKGMETTVMLHNRYRKGQPTAEELTPIMPSSLWSPYLPIRRRGRSWPPMPWRGRIGWRLRSADMRIRPFLRRALTTWGRELPVQRYRI